MEKGDKDSARCPLTCVCAYRENKCNLKHFNILKQNVHLHAAYIRPSPQVHTISLSCEELILVIPVECLLG